MSSCSCVMPINWDVLWDKVVQDWLLLLSGSIRGADFYTKYVPEGDEYGDLLEDSHKAPGEYLSLFANPLRPPYFRLNIYNSGRCSEFLRKTDSVACPYLLYAAIKQAVAVNLPGNDSFADKPFSSIETPLGKKQVAGAKNIYRFLSEAFDVKWQSQSGIYTYSRNNFKTSSELHDLLESLFLYQYTLPGAWFPSESSVWPGSDGLSFAGYLSPIQVQSLQNELATWEAASLIEDDLFPLFVDRVKRAAESGFGLMTIHAGL